MGSQFVVYWLYDDRCVCPWSHGYVGATSNLPRRFWRHRHEGHFRGFKVLRLFSGTRNECYALEARLRPNPGIGWNRGMGGFSKGARGRPKTPEHAAKLRAAALRRWSDPEARAKQSAVVKESLKGIDRSGANNANFGKHMSEEAKQKVRDAIEARGGIRGANNPNWRGGRPDH